MLKNVLVRGQYLLILAICVSACAMTGCVESSFDLAKESRLPRSMTLPLGLTRPDVSVTLNLYTSPLGPDAKFILKDKDGKKLGEVTGRTQGSTTSNYYRILTDKGTTEIITLKPYREHDNMEPNGIPVA